MPLKRHSGQNAPNDFPGVYFRAGSQRRDRHGFAPCSVIEATESNFSFWYQHPALKSTSTGDNRVNVTSCAIPQIPLEKRLKVATR
jgi:hypothetical protein